MSFFDLTLLFQNYRDNRNSYILNNKINNIIKNEKYPPYNIKIEKNNLYIIEVSVAGFTEDELLVTINDNHLVIKSVKE